MFSWFEATAHDFLEKTAIKTDRNVLTYRELLTEVNKFALYLHISGIRSGSVIAIILPADYYSIISILASMKIGAVYVPIDISIPESYLKTILDDSRCDFLICHEESDYKIRIPSIKITDVLKNEINKCLQDYLPPAFRDLAYIIYTSGTSGKPKGVKISHDNIKQLMLSTQHEYSLDCNDIVILYHSLSFDFSVWEIWSVLCYGGTLVIPSRQAIKSAEETFDILLNEKVTVLNQTPTAFKQLSAYQERFNRTELKELRLIIFGGEKLNPEYLRDFHRINNKVKFYNMYGITEVTVHGTIKQITSDYMISSSNIGKPLPGRSIYLLDDNRKCVPYGEVGEIYISGLGISSGYVNLEKENRQVFLPDLLDSTKIMYKTGDLALIKNGDLEYIGRKDKQIQFKGFRIELSGIEAILNKHEGLKYSAVDVIDNNIVAYIVPAFNKLPPFICKNPIDGVYTLPNGMPIYHLNKNETEFLYEEIFEKKLYLFGGLKLPEDACILDVGANIGLFSLQMKQYFPGTTIYAVEPILDIYNVLQANIELYELDVKAINIGFDSTNQRKVMCYYPKMSIMSSVDACLDDERELIHTYIKKKIRSNHGNLADDELSDLVDTYLEKINVECQFKTLDLFIAENKIKKIDLLKIDTEKSELDILSGLTKKNWGIIKQCVIEVHDSNNKKQKIIDILLSNKFLLKIHQHEDLKKSNLYIIYASKDPNFATENTIPHYGYKYKWYNQNAYINNIRKYLKKNLPEYSIPQYYKIVEAFPLTSSNKIDFSKFNLSADYLINDNLFLDKISLEEKELLNNLTTNDEYLNEAEKPGIRFSTYDEFICVIVKTWEKLLRTDYIDIDDNIFDIGGNSLMVIEAYLLLQDKLPSGFRMIDFFNYPTPRKLAEKIMKVKDLLKCDLLNNTVLLEEEASNDIAIIGYAGIFPQAKNLEQYWYNIVNGIDCISHFTDQELKKYGVNENYLYDNNFIKSCGKIDGIDLFDNDFFGITPKEAALMDPQHRIFLDICRKALEDSNYVPEKTRQKIGIYAGMGHTHYLDILYKFHGLKHIYGRDLILEITNHKDYLVNRVAYKLNLTGASVNINTACSTSLVACVKACQSLLINESDIVIAGGVSIVLPENYGYFYQKDSVLSPDGVCRPFDELANGTVISSGAGVVVLKRLKNALRDGDNIRAIIKGYAINNDGNKKIGFTAPSVAGQAECINIAQIIAGIDCRDISYIEAHGTGTKLGDPLEFEALVKIFKKNDYVANQCALGSVKGNIGHADSAAGIAGLLKVILMLEHRQIPPTVNFNVINEQIKLNDTPFYINNKLKNWDTGNNLYAGVSSFGIGGTNAHIILTNFSNSIFSSFDHDTHLLILSAKIGSNLKIMRTGLLAILRENPSMVGDIAYSLQVGRKDFKLRLAWIVTEATVIKQVSEYPQGNIDASNCSDSQLIITAKKWLNGALIDWQDFHKACKHRRVAIPNYPLNYKKYWYNDAKFTVAQSHIARNDLLLEICSNVLGVKEISLNDNFFNSGGDSLSALSVIEEINNKLHVQLSLDDIYEVKTLKELLEIIKIKRVLNHEKIKFLNNIYVSSSKGSQIVMKRTPNRHVLNKINNCEVHKKSLLRNMWPGSLILIHPINGSLYCYDYFNRDLGNYDIWGISADGISSSSINTIEGLASEYIELIEASKIKQPYVLLGWSFGGTLAYEIGRQLKLKTINIEHLFMLDSWRIFGENFNKNESFLAKIYNERMMYSRDSKWAKKWNKRLWQRCNMIFNYQPLAYNIPVTLFKAKIILPEFEVIDDPTNHWLTVLGDNLSTININADHQTILNEENSVQISRIVDEILQKKFENI